MNALQGRVLGASMVRSRAIFGREPAAWVGLIESVLVLLVLFPAVNAFGLTQEWATLVVAVVSALAGVYTAWATRDTALGAILGLVRTVVALVAFYGIGMTTDQQGALLATVAVVFGFWQRTQTSPVDAPVDPSPQQVTASPVGVESTIPGATLDEDAVARGVRQQPDQG